MKRKFGEAIALTVAGIKCDNQPICTWQDESVKVVDYDKWMNRPCPICGSNLLTPEDLATVKTMHVIIRFINACLFPIMAIWDIRRLFGAPDKGIKIRGNMDGSGKITFTAPKLDNGWELCPTCQSFHPADQKCIRPRRNW